MKFNLLIGRFWPYALFFILLIAMPSFGVAQIKKPKIKRASAAYGFILGQEQSLQYIREQYPRLEFSVFQAENVFKASFGQSRINLQKYLIGFMGQDAFKTLEDTLLKTMKKNAPDLFFSEERALNMLSTVHDRSRGEISSPILETILAFQYDETPQDEIASGFVQVFRTKGHAKAKETDWQIKIPLSWSAEEAERPNIIQKFISESGDGRYQIMLDVKKAELLAGKKLTRAEELAMFSEHNCRSSIPDGGTFISYNKMTFDRIAGASMVFDQVAERLDTRVKVRTVQFIFVLDGMVYMLHCFLMGESASSDLTKEWSKVRPLFLQVAHSIVVFDQYK